MAQHPQLKAEKRDMLGKKVRRLRSAGILPATVYGHNVTPQSIQIDGREFRNLLKAQGRTQLIDLVIESDQARPVFVKQTSIDAKRNEVVHVEFFQANLREKLTTRVPLHVVGESQAVRDGGILLTVLDHVDIESLPDDVPATGLEVDITPITEINGAIHVGDLAAPAGVTVLTPADEVVVKVDPPVSEEVIQQAAADTEPLPAELGGDEPPPDSVPEA
jgi:large subunit ribosomal protein L25